MRRTDWTPVVLVTATISVTVVAGVLLTSPVFQGVLVPRPGPERARRRLQPDVVVWVGELAPGLKGVLGTVWGAERPDAVHDATLNEELGLEDGARLAYYRLLLFNTSDRVETVHLEDGALSIHPRGDGEQAAFLVNVADLLAGGAIVPSPALRTVLEGRGMLRRSIVVPPGRMADLLVAFQRRVGLDEAVSVASANGDAFERRPMARRALEDLITRPDEEGIRDL